MPAQHTGSDSMFLASLSPRANNWKNKLHFLVAKTKRFKTAVQNPIIRMLRHLTVKSISHLRTRPIFHNVTTSLFTSLPTGHFRSMPYRIHCSFPLSVLAMCAAHKMVVRFINITIFITRHVKIMKFLCLIQNCQITLSLLNFNIFQRALLQTLVIHSLYSGL